MDTAAGGPGDGTEAQLAGPADVQHYGQVMDRLCTRAELPAGTPEFLSRLGKEI